MLNKFQDARKISMTKTYSVTFAHVNMVKEMADELAAREGAVISDGEVVRRAIDALYGKVFDEPESPEQIPA
jgi:hypothetical protein